jgi:C-terminal processing protease CtpA/Prc
MNGGRTAPLLALLLLAAATATQAGSPSLNARVYDRAWSLVAKHYWDRSMGGNDWEAIHDRFRPRALAARDEKQLYAAINTMLDQLDDSHVYAVSPGDLAISREPPEERDLPPARRALRIDGGILLLAFDQFDPGDDRWIADAIADTPDLRGVILDLRQNAGGRDDVLDKIAGLFTSRREVLIRLTGKDRIEEKSRPNRRRSYGGPLAVIVGPGTASAAEILAFFLDETGRAVSVGERTAGAVTGGVDHRLPDGGRLTVAEYDIRTASGTRLEGRGFTPRHRVPDMPGASDAALAKAVALLRGTARQPT